MEKEEENENVEKPLKARRSSILKLPKLKNLAEETDVTETFTDINIIKPVRRVSFASSNFIKPFVADPEKNTIWDTTYEEDVNHTNSTQSSQEQIASSITKFGSTFFDSTAAKTSSSILNATTFSQHDMEITHGVLVIDKENIPILPSASKKISIVDFAKKLSSNSVGPNFDSILNHSRIFSDVDVRCENLTKLSTQNLEFTCQGLAAVIHTNESAYNIKASSVMEIETEVDNGHNVMDTSRMDISMMEMTCQIFQKNSAERNIDVITNCENSQPTKQKDDLEFEDHISQINVSKTSVDQVIIPKDLTVLSDMELTFQLPPKNSERSGNRVDVTYNNVTKLGEDVESETDDVISQKDLTKASDMEFTCQLPHKILNQKGETKSIAQSPETTPTKLTDTLCQKDSTKIDADQVTTQKYLTEARNMEFTCQIPQKSSTDVTDDMAGTCQNINDNATGEEKFSQANLIKNNSLPMTTILDDLPVVSHLESVCQTPTVNSEKNLTETGDVNSTRGNLQAHLTTDDINITKGGVEISTMCQNSLVNPIIENDKIEVDYQNSQTDQNLSKNENGVTLHCQSLWSAMTDNKENISNFPQIYQDILKINDKSVEQLFDNATSTKTRLISDCQVPEAKEFAEDEVNCEEIIGEVDNIIPREKPTIHNDSLRSVSEMEISYQTSIVNDKTLQDKIVISDALDCENPNTMTGLKEKSQINMNVDTSKIIGENACKEFPLSERNQIIQTAAQVKKISSFFGADNWKTPTPKKSKIPISTTPKSSKMEKLSKPLFQIKESDLNSTNEDFKTPDPSFHINLTNISSGVDDTQHLLQCTYLKTNPSFILSRFEKSDTQVLNLEDTGHVSKPNLTNIESTTPDKTFDFQLRNKLANVNDTYVLRDRKCNLNTKVEDENDEIESGEEDNSLGIIPDECMELEENILTSVGKVQKKEFNLNIKRISEISNMLKNIEKQRNHITSYLESFKFREMRIPEEFIVDEKSSTDSSECSKGDSTKENMAGTVSLEEKIRKHQMSCQNTWKLEGVEDDVYHLSTLFGTFLIIVFVKPETEIVTSVKTDSNLSEMSKPLARYMTTLFRNRLDEHHVRSAIGDHYDVLSLLDYIQMIMLRLHSFQIEFMTCENLTMEKDFVIKYKVISVPLAMIFYILVDVRDVDNLNFEKDIKVVTELGKINEEEVKNIMKNCPKGLDFFKSFIDHINEYLQLKKKRIRFEKGH